MTLQMLRYSLHITTITSENMFLLYSIFFLRHSLLFRNAWNQNDELITRYSQLPKDNGRDAVTIKEQAEKRNHTRAEKHRIQEQWCTGQSAYHFEKEREVDFSGQMTTTNHLVEAVQLCWTAWTPPPELSLNPELLLTSCKTWNESTETL